VGQAEKGEAACHASNADRRADRAAIVDDIQAILRTKPRDEWLAIFMQAKVPAGPVNSVDDIARDPELLARGLLYTAEAADGRIPQVGLGSASTVRTPHTARRRRSSASIRRPFARLARLRHAGGGGAASAET
jgi:crotonobetainyl-CoA:carnitine CoA-transferase CaiB-like acyl-CoA transferase